MVYGGVTMNNTLCLGMFLAFIHTRNLGLLVSGAHNSARLCHQGALHKWPGYHLGVATLVVLQVYSDAEQR
ncbi:hypothetical protein GUJ93_ZPchr0008g11980 [Zizania palustris]|uniref:Uncharacterized protein n=1 Tax=Zizania palustris TaxID=103762 RepID=A0A8J5RFF1_ZIZPA|nr:hypothetical protein GUJ93_ZPchr0008g11980 [Zizania palustris]